MGIENSFTDMHVATIAMVRCLQLGSNNMLLGFLQLAMGEVVDGAKCFLADKLAQHREGQSGPWLTSLHALGTDVSDEPLQVLMLTSKSPVVLAEISELGSREPLDAVMMAARAQGG